jgi:hypothetical protein
MSGARRRWAALLCCCAVGGAWAAMGKEAYKAHQERIQAEYEALSVRCKPLKGHQREVCKAEARASREVARAQLQLQYKPTPENEEKLRLVQADATFDVTRERCDGHKNGHAREVCRKDAKAVWAAARAEAKSSRVAAAR